MKPNIYVNDLHIEVGRIKLGFSKVGSVTGMAIRLGFAKDTIKPRDLGRLADPLEIIECP